VVFATFGAPRVRSRIGLISLTADEVPEFYCRAWSGFSSRWIAYVDCDQDYQDKFELLGPVSINGKVYRCIGVLVAGAIVSDWQTARLACRLTCRPPGADFWWENFQAHRIFAAGRERER
jgi:hypothetical protein